MATYLLLLNGETNIPDDESFSEAAREWAELESEEDQDAYVFHWSTGVRNTIEEGDFLVLVRIGNRRVIGDSRRGVVAYGYAKGDSYKNDHFIEERAQRGDKANYVQWRPWHLQEEPIITVLELQELFPDMGWNPQGGGNRIPDDVAEELMSILDKRVGFTSLTDEELEELGEQEVPLPKELLDDVPTSYSRVVSAQRNHQRKFRSNLFEAAKRLYGEARCLKCGFAETKLLEAAHVIPDSEGGRANVKNGMLLCPNHHRALDLKMYRVVGEWPDWQIEIDEGFYDFGTIACF